MTDPTLAAAVPVEPVLRPTNDREFVRTRPSMFCGGLNARGLHHLLYELVDNGLAEAAAGFATTVCVTVYADGSCTVDDDGRGIPVGPYPLDGRPTVERVFDTLGGTPDVHGDGEPTPGGFHPHGIGATVTNYLSESFDVQVSRGGHVHRVRFERGVRTRPLGVVGPTDRTGTRVTFRPDRTLFKGLAFDGPKLARRLRELAALHASVTVVFEDDRAGMRDVFRFDAGLADYVARHLATRWPARTGVVAFRRADPARRIAVDGAVQFVGRPGMAVHTFVNGEATVGGTHLAGFHAGVASAVGRWADAAGVRAGSRHGLVGAVSVCMAEPSYLGCTKDELGMPEVADVVAAAVLDGLLDHLRSHPDQARAVVGAGAPAATFSAPGT